MSRDYTQEAPVVETLQNALDQAFGADAVGVGRTYVAPTVEAVCQLLSAAHVFGGHVTTGQPGPDEVGLSLEKVNSVREIDAVSGIVTVEAGCTPAELQRAVGDAGFQVEFGHFLSPDRPLGQAVMAGEGTALIVSTGAILPDGTLFHTPVAPRRASGPNPDALLVGTHGRLGVVVWLTLRLIPKPVELAVGSRRGAGPAMLNALRELHRAGHRPHNAWLLVETKGRATVVVEAANRSVEPLVAALASKGSRVVKPPEAPIMSSPPRRLGWRAIAELLDTPGLFVGPTDVHGGWARVPGRTSESDGYLDTMRKTIDPQDTLRVR
jgi:FAD/FMN-containing dehydrogenase